eukprot:4142492-Prymnesium_polylepis.1
MVCCASIAPAAPAAISGDGMRLRAHVPTRRPPHPEHPCTRPRLTTLPWGAAGDGDADFEAELGDACGL